MKSRVPAILASFTPLLLAPGARASEPVVEATTAAPRPMPRVSLTFSPLYLFVPMGVVAGEVRLRDKVSVAALAGAGWMTQESPGLETHLRILEAGAQARYYVLGTFRHGVQLGAEALYLHVDSPFTHQFPVTSSGFALGPFVGYKLATAIGFTFDAQVGWQYLWARGASNGAVNTGQTSIPLLNVNVGWSF